MEYLTKRLSDEQREYWEEQLAKAVPYTQEESDAIPFDSDPMITTGIVKVHLWPKKFLRRMTN